ncbi:hypothetical protein BD626DRAFT_472045 [Schizophyllum amplum]|uniref:Uncharacterized protein n=1 Tax=Schizophyllum amplum TaxID=97359 RepID=A0A550CVL3_9AGAR|nr:hypothetical protein BD626DRAFT_472045 [Auriculariopsis ampla]
MEAQKEYNDHIDQVENVLRQTNSLHKIDREARREAEHGLREQKAENKKLNKQFSKLQDLFILEKRAKEEAMRKQVEAEVQREVAKKEAAALAAERDEAIHQLAALKSMLASSKRKEAPSTDDTARSLKGLPKRAKQQKDATELDGHTVMEETQ